MAELMEFKTPGFQIDPKIAFKGYEHLIPSGRMLPLGNIDLEDIQMINIGGVTRHIASFNDIARREPTDVRIGGQYFTPNNYLSILMNNFGYNKRPENMDWMNEGVPIENVPKTVPLDYSPTRNALAIKHDRMLLFDLLTVIYFWGRGRIEYGYILDEDNSFKFPPKNEMLYCLQNNIEIKLSAAISTEKVHWCISDILTRRLHNICPHINKEYHFNCIRNFKGYAKQIWIDNPTPVFISAMIDPTILMTIIRNSEIEACKIVNERYGQYKAMRPDVEVAAEFSNILTEKLNHLKAIYKKYGASGFVSMVREEYVIDTNQNIIMNSAMALNVDKYDRIGELKTVEEKRKFIDDIEVDSNLIKNISKYLDFESLPDYVTKRKQVRDELGNTITEYTDVYYSTMRRLGSVFEQMSVYYPSKVDSASKWIMSKPFFINGDAFGLYNQTFKEFLLAFPDVTWKICDSREAIKTYKDRYGMDVLLDADELGDSLESSEPKNRVFKDEIPYGDEGKYVKPSVEANLEVAGDVERTSMVSNYADEIMDKESLAKLLATRFTVKK